MTTDMTGVEGEEEERVAPGSIGCEWSSTIEEMSCQANGSARPEPEKPINLTATINEQRERRRQAVTTLQAQEGSHAERRELS